MIEPNGSDAQPRGCLPTLLVLVTMVGIVLSGAVAAGAVEDLPSPQVEVARGVTITPVDEWEFGGRTDDGTGVLLSKGSGSLLIAVQDRAATP